MLREDPHAAVYLGLITHALVDVVTARSISPPWPSGRFSRAIPSRIHRLWDETVSDCPGD